MHLESREHAFRHVADVRRTAREAKPPPRRLDLAEGLSKPAGDCTGSQAPVLCPGGVPLEDNARASFRAVMVTATRIGM